MHHPPPPTISNVPFHCVLSQPIMSQLYYSMSQQHVKSTNSNTTSDPERANAPISTSSSLVSRCLAPPSSPLPIPDPKYSKTVIYEDDAEHCKLFIYNVVLSIVLLSLLSYSHAFLLISSPQFVREGRPMVVKSQLYVQPSN